MPCLARLGEAVLALHETYAADCPYQDVNERADELAPDADGTLLCADTLLHGDCCLPNVFFADTSAQFIDLGVSGLGDWHVDLYKAMWSLQYNLKTDRYGERFLDAYGRDRLDWERLNLCVRMDEGRK